MNDTGNPTTEGQVTLATKSILLVLYTSSTATESLPVVIWFALSLLCLENHQHTLVLSTGSSATESLPMAIWFAMRVVPIAYATVLQLRYRFDPWLLTYILLTLVLCFTLRSES